MTERITSGKPDSMLLKKLYLQKISKEAKEKKK